MKLMKALQGKEMWIVAGFLLLWGAVHYLVINPSSLERAARLDAIRYQKAGPEAFGPWPNRQTP